MGNRILVILLLFAYSGSNAQNGDINLLKTINKYRNNSSEGLMEFVSNSDYAICGAVPFIQLVTAYASKDRQMQQNGFQTVIGFGYTIALTELYKYSLQRDRPAVTYPGIIKPYQSVSDPSLPSGHTSMAFCTATTLSLCYPRWYVIAPVYLWAGTVGYSQMYLGMHYPSDVLFGAIVGAGSSWLSLKTNQWINKNRESKTLISY